MNSVIGVHKYTLKPGMDGREFEDAILDAKKRSLLKLPGLIDYFLIKGIRGFRNSKYGAVWVYERIEVWEKLWGPIDKPIGKEAYPPNWLVWENEVLQPFLEQDPDTIAFTSYQEF